MIQSPFPKNIFQAIYLTNMVPTQVLHNKSPYLLLYGQLFDLFIVKFFMSLCCINSLVPHRGKFDTRAHNFAFLGFKPGLKGFVAYDIHTKSIHISRNAISMSPYFPVILLPGHYLTLVESI